MKLTTNYGLKKPENTDVVNIEDLNENADIIDKGLVPYIGVTSGSGNTYAITSGNIKNLTIGLAFSIKFNADSTGDCTLNVNSNGAKPIKKANGSTMTSLKASGIYTLRYDGVNFILQGEGASGNATASDLLSGKTASTDAGEISGTMPDIGPSGTETVNLTSHNQEYLIEYGRHSGLRKVKATISGLIASVIKAGTTVGGILGTYTSDATATSGDIIANKTAYVNGNKLTGGMTNQGTVNHALPINSSYTIPAGYHSGSGKVTQSITTKGAQTYTPSTLTQIIPANQYLSGAQTIAGSSNLVAGNIRAGVNLFGVVGNSNVVDTGAGDAVNGQMLEGTKAYVKGALVTGAIPRKIAQTYTPSTVNQTIGAGQYLSGAQTILGDANLIASNILTGKSIFGVAGNVIPGKRFASGVVTMNTGRLSFMDWGDHLVYMNYFTVSGLAFKPSVIIVVKEISCYYYFSIYIGAVGAVSTGCWQYRGENTLLRALKNGYYDGYVNSTGFQLPNYGSGSAYSYDWYAWE